MFGRKKKKEETDGARQAAADRHVEAAAARPAYETEAAPAAGAPAESGAGTGPTSADIQRAPTELDADENAKSGAARRPPMDRDENEDPAQAAMPAAATGPSTDATSDTARTDLVPASAPTPVPTPASAPDAAPGDVPAPPRGGRLRKRLKRLLTKCMLILVALALIGVSVLYVMSSTVERNTEGDIVYTVRDTENIRFDALSMTAMKRLDPECILVLGAGIKDENTPSDMLRDRLDAAIALYEAGVAPKLLLSGDNGQKGYNELHVMFQYCLQRGIPREDLFCDHAGFSTYDSLYRASSIFEVQRAIVVTQTYHEYRALYVAKNLGISALGVASDQEKYRGALFREGREVLARAKDLVKSHMRPAATVGGEPIPISGSALPSQDE